MGDFTKAHLAELANHREGPCITLFLPTGRSREESSQGAIRLKNLIARAEESLCSRGLRAAAARQLMQVASELTGDSDFWRERQDSLGVFIAEGFFRTMFLPIALTEQVVVGPRFQIKPLLPLLVADGRFFVVALSQHAVRLLRCSRHSMESVALNGVPQGISAALGPEFLEKQVQYHTGSPSGGDRRAAVFHGQGGHKDVNKDAILRYFREIDRGLERVLRGEKAPLILAGVDYLLPIFRDVCGYSNVHAQSIVGNPDRLPDGSLHREGWHVVGTLFQEGESQAVARLEEATSKGHGSTTLEEILQAAHHGRVEALFISPDTERWGVFDRASGQAARTEGPGSAGEDLLNLAVVQVLASAGAVHTLPKETEAHSGPVAAIFRF